jgi:hypothetical protein
MAWRPVRDRWTGVLTAPVNDDNTEEERRTAESRGALVERGGVTAPQEAARAV